MAGGDAYSTDLGENRGNCVAILEGRNGLTPAVNFPMSLKQLSADLSPFLLHSLFILPLSLCSI